MSHRGRLNRDSPTWPSVPRPTKIFCRLPEGRRTPRKRPSAPADVKYHMGATRRILKRAQRGAAFTSTSSQIPSHLEAVDPVHRRARTRAKTRSHWRRRTRKISATCLSMATPPRFAGQGHPRRNHELPTPIFPVTPVGGTIHIIVNNLIGFTTSYTEEHSTRFAACIARRQSIPIFHVNGEGR